MGYIARLTYGSNTLNLNDSTYSLMPDFAPPGIVRAVNLASGTFRNKSGGKRAGAQPKDRPWSFGVRCLGASAAETHAAVSRLQYFLDRCADPSETLYLEYAPSDAISTNPLWGQAVYRYEIKDAVCRVGDLYGVASLRSLAIIVGVELLIGPYAEGISQYLAAAKGCLLMDLSQDGAARGVIVNGAITNLLANPSSETNATSFYAVLGSTISRVLHPKAPFGSYCMKCVTPNAAANEGIGQNGTISSDGTYTGSVWVWGSGTVYARSEGNNGGVHVSSAVTLSAIPQRLITTVTTSGSSTFVRVKILTATQQAATFYTDGWQLQVGSYASSYVDGDMLGCAWTGSSHASTTTSTGGVIKLPIDGTVIDPAQGTIRMAVKMPYNQDVSADKVLFEADSPNGLQLSYIAASNTWRFRDGTNLVSSSAQTFSTGTIFIFHCVWGGGQGVKLYINGGVDGSSSSFNTPLGSNLYIGSNSSGTAQFDGLIMDFTVWDIAATASEVSADYANIMEWVRGGDGSGQQLNSLPWLWTKDGDNVVDNCDDSTRDNWCAVGGVPGSEEALTRWYITPSSLKEFWLGQTHYPYGDFVYPTGQCYLEGSGTATSDTDSGSAVATVTVDGTADSLLVLTTTKPWLFSGNSHYFVRLSSITGSLTVAPYYYIVNTIVTGDYKAITTDVNRRWFYVGSLAPEMPDFLEQSETRLLLGIYGKRTSGSGDALVDFGLVINGRLLLVTPPSVVLGAVHYLVEGLRAMLLDTNYIANDRCNVRGGEPIDLLPGRLNVIWWMNAAHGQTHTVADTGTFSKVYVTPRWALV